MIHTTYFARLNKLPDNIVPIAISRTVPDSIGIRRYSKLAPSYDLLAKYKQDGDWEAYTKVYNEYLKTLDADEIVVDLCEIAGGLDFALVCYEGKGPCHRHLVAEWLRENGYNAYEYYGDKEPAWKSATCK